MVVHRTLIKKYSLDRPPSPTDVTGLHATKLFSTYRLDQDFFDVCDKNIWSWLDSNPQSFGPAY